MCRRIDLARICLRPPSTLASRFYSVHRALLKDPRLEDIGKVLKDEYSVIRTEYSKPKHPIVLAHGLLGFDEMRLAGAMLPGIQYWRGIREALSARGIEVIIAVVPPSGSIEARAAKLAECIAEKAHGKSVNVIAHSMGGLDARYCLSQLKPSNVDIRSLTTIATPHRGSAFADYMFTRIGTFRPRLYKVLESLGMETGAFSQLTIDYMTNEFNPRTPDVEGIRYFSYGATLAPTYWSIFKPSHDIIKRLEGAENDGLVSVPSSVWGNYKGTLVGVSHIDLINWTNRLKWLFWQLTGSKVGFNAIAFYLDITDMLAKEGL